MATSKSVRLGVAVSLVLCLAGGPALGAGSGSKVGEKLDVRHKFREGRQLRYRLVVDSDLRWRPSKSGLSRSSVDTDFTFKLTAKAVRQSGACTFGLVGEKLTSKVSNNKGTFRISASKSSFRVRNSKGSLKLKKNPITQPMSVTLGPRGAVLFGTRLLPVLPFFAVGVGQPFWRHMTLAPLAPVAVGDVWDINFQRPLPDSTGGALEVVGKVKATGWRTVRRRKCLVLRAEGKATLKDTTVTLKNGDRVQIKSAVYDVKGAAMWDLKRGLLCYADAECELRVSSDKPSKRSLSGQSKSKLELLSVK
jgi:hypothetical protein